MWGCITYSRSPSVIPRATRTLVDVGLDGVQHGDDLTVAAVKRDRYLVTAVSGVDELDVELQKRVEKTARGLRARRDDLERLHCVAKLAPAQTGVP